MIFKPVFSGIAIALLIFCLAWPAMAKMPWEVWDYSKEKPVRGGYYRTASSVDVGLLNPNHWPVLDWLVINYFFEKFLITDGTYRPVNWMMDGWEYPTSSSSPVCMCRR